MPTSIAKQARLLVTLSLDPQGVVSPARVQAILDTLEHTRSLALLRPLLKAFYAALRREIAHGKVLIEHAGPLEPGTEERIAALFSRHRGRPVSASATENPSLVAGMRIRIGDDVYDTSLRGILDRLESEVAR